MANVPCNNPNICGVRSHRQGSESERACGSGWRPSRGGVGPKPPSAPPRPSLAEDTKTAAGIERAFAAVDEQSDFGWGSKTTKELAGDLLTAGVRTNDGRGARELTADLDDLRERVDGDIEPDEYSMHLAERGWTTRSQGRKGQAD